MSTVNFAGLNLLERHDLERQFESDTRVSDDLWRDVEEKARLAANARTVSSYENACESLLLLRQVAHWTGQTLRFNALLCDFRRQHQTKSMLIAMLSRRVSSFSV